MSLDDFERCTPSEFTRIYECWTEHEKRLVREGWEQTRTLVGFILPIYRSRKSAKQLLPFPWDQDEKKAVPKGGSTPEAFRELLRLRANGG